jgi:hypothetical protein
MSVYVDPLREYGGSKTFRWTISCHMYADTLEELHEMAMAIGMKRSWFQDKPHLPHYDLVTARRAKAVRLGAVEVSLREMVEFMRRRRRMADEVNQSDASEDRCGFRREQGLEDEPQQCIYFAGHKEPLHRFGPLLPWPPVYFSQELTDNQEGPSPVQKVLKSRARKVPGKKKSKVG